MIGILICAGIFFVAIAYVRMRDGIAFEDREGWEKFVMILLLIVLILNIIGLLFETKEKGESLNDCIRFYRYFPDAADKEFYFIRETCYEYYDEEDIEKLKQSGRNWHKKQLEQGYYFPKLNIGEIE